MEMSSETPSQTTPIPPTWSCNTHKQARYQQRELRQQQLLLSTLLADLRRATNHWFQAKSDDCFQLLVQSCVKILQHGLIQPTNGEEMRRFYEDFEFLRLTLQNQQEQEQQQLVPGTSSGCLTANLSIPEFLQQWTGDCLRAGCLSHCIESLLSDKELLNLYYKPDWAFLRHNDYANSLFICLTAIQLDEISLLSQLEPLHRQCRRHRRTSSQPNFNIRQQQRLHAVQEEDYDHMPVSSSRQMNVLRRIKSLPSLCLHGDSCSLDRMQTCANLTVNDTDHDAEDLNVLLRPRCQTYKSTRARWHAARHKRHGVHLKELSGSSISTASSSCSQTASPSTQQSQRRIQLIDCDDIKIWTDQTNCGNIKSTTPVVLPTAMATQKTHSARRLSTSFLSNLFGAPPVYTTWYSKALDHDNETSSALNFLPVNGRKLNKRQQQSLFEGVSMLDYNNTNESEIAAAASRPLDIVTSQQSQASTSYSTTPCSLSSDSQHSNSNSNKIDNQSFAAFLQMSRYSHNNTDLEKENAHFRISEACITAIEHVKWSRRGQSATAAAATAQNNTEVDALLMPFVEQHNVSGTSGGINGNNNNNSAEAVGLQLISRFNDQQLPKLADIKWLVSEQDTPQQLLPMPKSPQQQHHQQNQQQLIEEASLTRGTNTWAPPRQQIIFTQHLPASRSELLTRQNYRCAGCGMHVTRQYQQHFRYCNYLGKYLCTGCHRNQLSAIPAKILQAWDFHSYAVSSFAYRLIEKMYTFPLFYVPDLNAHLYAKQKTLARAKRRRIQLNHVREFIVACRFATREKELFTTVPAHITNDPDLWSMCDFVDVQNDSMRRSIEELIALSEQHVNNCVLCTGRAFICEYCRSPNFIYPWQRKVHRCDQCGVCAHYKCWKAKSKDVCQRCERLRERKKQSATSGSGTRS